MLNAFRHQRKKHTTTRAGSVDENGSAQRLSASTEETRRSGTCGQSLACVLNAFRHQRKKHVNVHAPPPGPPVGAQRLSASTEETRNGRAVGIVGNRSNSAQRLSASTEETLNRSQPTPDGGFLSVLNAFRHQRKKHANSVNSPPPPRTCSTPFGINGSNTNGGSGSYEKQASAQRLSASTEETLIGCWLFDSAK